MICETFCSGELNWCLDIDERSRNVLLRSNTCELILNCTMLVNLSRNRYIFTVLLYIIAYIIKIDIFRSYINNQKAKKFCVLYITYSSFPPMFVNDGQFSYIPFQFLFGDFPPPLTIIASLFKFFSVSPLSCLWDIKTYCDHSCRGLHLI